MTLRMKEKRHRNLLGGGCNESIPQLSFSEISKVLNTKASILEKEGKIT